MTYVFVVIFRFTVMVYWPSYTHTDVSWDDLDLTRIQSPTELELTISSLLFILYHKLFTSWSCGSYFEPWDTRMWSLRKSNVHVACWLIFDRHLVEAAGMHHLLYLSQMSNILGWICTFVIFFKHFYGNLTSRIMWKRDSFGKFDKCNLQLLAAR